MRSSRINELTKWSNLARLASGNLPKLTIVAPFIAFIILHNEPLQPVLELSESRHSNQVVEFFALARFDIFYLGLIIIGAAVGIFTVFCPRQITGYGSYEDFVQIKERTKTSNGVAGSLRLTLESFVAENQSGDADLDETGTSRRFPRRFREGLAALLATTAERHSAEGEEAEALELLQVLHRRDPNERHLWRPIYGRLGDQSIDIYRLEYVMADYSMPTLRASIFWLLIFGTAVVLVPTFITTYLVLSDLGVAAEMAVDSNIAPVE